MDVCFFRFFFADIVENRAAKKRVASELNKNSNEQVDGAPLTKKQRLTEQTAGEIALKIHCGCKGDELTTKCFFFSTDSAGDGKSDSNEREKVDFLARTQVHELVGTYGDCFGTIRHNFTENGNADGGGRATFIINSDGLWKISQLKLVGHFTIETKGRLNWCRSNGRMIDTIVQCLKKYRNATIAAMLKHKRALAGKFKSFCVDLLEIRFSNGNL